MWATIGDPEGTRTLTSLIALLAAIGVALLMVAVWMYRATRPDPELLAPLEAMGERKWRRADPVWQRRRLDELRPDGAEPLAPSAAPPELDESFDAGPTVSGFDDLRTRPGESERDLGATGDPTTGGDVDPDLLAQAREQLERELAARAPAPRLPPPGVGDRGDTVGTSDAGTPSARDADA